MANPFDQFDGDQPPGGTNLDVPTQRTMVVTPEDQRARDRARLSLLKTEGNDPSVQRSIRDEVARGIDSPPRYEETNGRGAANPFDQFDDQQQLAAATAPAGLSPQAREFAITDKPGYAEQFVGGAKHAWDRAATGLESLVPGGKTLSKALDQPDMQQLVKQGGQFVKETGPASTVGQIAGDVAMSAAPIVKVGQAARVLGKYAPLAAETVASGGYGALTADEGEKLMGGALGAGGNLAAAGVVRALRGIVKPTDEARLLMDKGVALTPGQAAGKDSFIKRVEEQAASLPVASHFIKGAQNRAVGEANVAAAQSVVDVLGQKIKLGAPPREAIERTREEISKVYDAALEGVSIPALIPDAMLMQLKNGYKLTDDSLARPLQEQFPMLERSELNKITRYMKERVGNAGKNNGGMLTGDMLKQIDSELGGYIRNLSKSPNAADKTAAPAWGEVQNVIRNAIELGQADPAKTAALKQANIAYRQLLAMERTLLPGNETFTPRRLQATLQKMGIKGTNLNQIADSMSATLPNQVPNSGTADRLLATALPGLLFGGGAGAQGMGFDTLGTGMMAAGALGSRTGAKLMTGGAAGQQATASTVNALRRGVPGATAGRQSEKTKEDQQKKLIDAYARGTKR